MPQEMKTFMVEDARLIFRNFEGREGPYNQPGDRNFCVVLTPEVAKAMHDDGWNVKETKPQEVEDGEEAEPGTPYIAVKVGYKVRPPKIVAITDTGRTNLNEDTVGTLDWADIRTVDLVANAYEWEVGAKSGIKAYLKTMFVTIEEDALERKYALMEQE